MGYDCSLEAPSFASSPRFTHNSCDPHDTGHSSSSFSNAFATSLISYKFATGKFAYSQHPKLANESLRSGELLPNTAARSTCDTDIKRNESCYTWQRLQTRIWHTKLVVSHTISLKPIPLL